MPRLRWIVGLSALAVIVLVAPRACDTSVPVPPAAISYITTQTRQAAQTLASKLQADNTVQLQGDSTSSMRCGSGGSYVQYVTQQSFKAIDPSPAQFNTQLASELSGAGWKVTAEPAPDLGGILYSYDIANNNYDIANSGLSGQMFVGTGPAGLSADIIIHSACFDAGPEAVVLLERQGSSGLLSP